MKFAQQHYDRSKIDTKQSNQLNKNATKTNPKVNKKEIISRKILGHLNQKNKSVDLKIESKVEESHQDSTIKKLWDKSVEHKSDKSENDQTRSIISHKKSVEISRIIQNRKNEPSKTEGTNVSILAKRRTVHGAPSNSRLSMILSKDFSKQRNDSRLSFDHTFLLENEQAPDGNNGKQTKVDEILQKNNRSLSFRNSLFKVKLEEKKFSILDPSPKNREKLGSYKPRESILKRTDPAKPKSEKMFERVSRTFVFRKPVGGIEWIINCNFKLWVNSAFHCHKFVN